MSIPFVSPFAVPTLGAAAVAEKLKSDNVYCIDCRTAEEQELSIVNDAYTIEEFEQLQVDKDTAILVSYCTVGLRSGVYTSLLKSKGYNAFNSQGVIAFSHNSDIKFVDKFNKKTKAIHTFSSDFSKNIATTYKATFFQSKLKEWYELILMVVWIFMNIFTILRYIQFNNSDIIRSKKKQ